MKMKEIKVRQTEFIEKEADKEVIEKIKKRRKKHENKDASHFNN